MNGRDSSEFFYFYILDYGVSQRFFLLYTFALHINFTICALAFWKAGGNNQRPLQISTTFHKILMAISSLIDKFES